MTPHEALRLQKGSVIRFFYLGLERYARVRCVIPSSGAVQIQYIDHAGPASDILVPCDKIKLVEEMKPPEVSNVVLFARRGS
jgi:hypothetical protein